MNPLVRDRDVEFLLYEVLDAERLCELPQFKEHSRETFDMFIGQSRRIARELLFPAYRAMDEAPPKLVDGRVIVHPKMHEIYRQLVDLGICEDVDGFIANSRVQRNLTDRNRLDAVLAPNFVNQLMVSALLVQFRL